MTVGLGAPITAVYSRFDPRPVAAGKGPKRQTRWSTACPTVCRKAVTGGGPPLLGQISKAGSFFVTATPLRVTYSGMPLSS